MKVDDVIAAWDEADPRALHPSRDTSEAAYWRSGRAQAKQIASVLTPGANVLDYGCGDGRVAVGLKKLGFDVTAADTSQKMLDRLTKKNPKIPTVLAPSGYLDLADYDAVVCLAVLIHHDYAGCRDIIRSLRDYVTPNGLLILDWPTSDAPSERRSWIEVTTWRREDQLNLARELGMIPVDLDLPWTAWRCPF